MNNSAFAIIDAQRGFMPASEGEKLNEQGFGELPVTGGELIVSNLNALTDAALTANIPIVTTQDWHPEQTAHFSKEPNYVDTWPVHCVADTSGAKLHPWLRAAYDPLVEHFIKGMDAAKTPAEDTSYTGFLAQNSETGQSLPEALRAKRVKNLYIAGLALGDGLGHPLCVDSTALDFKKAGFDVTVITDAVEAVLPQNRELCFKNLGKAGVRLATTQEILAEIRAMQEA